MQRTRRRPSLKVSSDGRNLVAHAGTRLLTDLADRVGLTDGLSVAMAPTKQRRRGYDRGQVLVDLAVVLADGGETLSDVWTLRDQPEVFGDVASPATVWRTLDAVDEQSLERIAVARAAARASAWRAGADPGFYVLDVDATLVNSHSEKEGAAPTWKRGFGFHPLLVYLDATGEALAGKLRPGNAGSNTTADHIEVLDAALVQLPVDPTEREVIMRADTGGLSHGFVDACRDRQVRFVIGLDLTENVRSAVLHRHVRWIPASSADGTEEREHAEVAEVTHLLDVSGWPVGTRVIARREDPHPGAQLTFTDVDGHRFQTLITDLPDDDIAYIEAVYRGRGRCEKRICDAKDLGLRNLPSERFAINTVWLQLVLMAQDLLAWVKLLLLADTDLARAEPKRLRYCLWHTAGIIARGGRRTRLRLADTWPWTRDLITAFHRLDTLPHA